MSQSPAEWLRLQPRGAYTTLLVRGACHELVDWPTHLERLVLSLRAMHKALGIYSQFYSWLAATGAPEHAALQQLLVPPMQAVLQSAHDAEAAGRDLMLIVLLPPAPGVPSGLDVLVHAHLLRSQPSSEPGTALLLGGPRGIPVGKDSGWATERQPLEALRPPGIADVLLCSRDGRLLEGLVTNLFVVAAASEASSGSGSTGSSSRLGPAAVVVYTAGMGDGVVWGTARARVLEACRQLGLEVREEAPAAAARGTWREAFLTNSLRLVQPLASIACGASNVWGLEPWELQLPQAPGPVTTAVREALRTLPVLPVAQLGSCPLL